MPHKTTWGRILAGAVDIAQLEALVGEFFAEQLGAEVPARGSVVVNLDGKTLRGTIPKGKTQGVHLMALFWPKQGLVLAQLAVGRKENEIVAAPKVVAQLDLQGMVVTGDAMQAQRTLSVEVVGRGGDWLWFVKENQPDLYTDLVLLFGPEPVAPGCSAPPTDFSTARQVDKGHGRLEIREIVVSSYLQHYTPWPHLAQAFKLERTVCNLRGEEQFKEVRYGITSLGREEADARRILQIAREGWGIENKLHWRRDVLLGEDHSQLRRGNSQEVKAILNNVVLGLIGASGQRNVAATRRELAYAPEKAIALLTKGVLSNK